MDRISVLLVEDEHTLAMIIRDTLNAQGFDITVACDGCEGLRLLSEIAPHVVVADVMMPRMDGFEMVRRMRRAHNPTPVLFLTARSAVADVVEGFEIGANDYLKKPFGMQELMVRIKALVGRVALNTGEEQPPAQWMEIGTYLFNPTLQRLQCGETTQELSYREAEILRRLILHRNQVVQTQSILLDLWGDDSFFNTRSLQVFITKLRHKLAKDNRLRIVNVRGVGYKLICVD
ncbi:MAG TPA: response regulator transcription factor [Prevotella sp.]